MMEKVNTMVRHGMNYVQISKIIGKSPRTIQRYHVGIADNCLPYCDGKMDHYQRCPWSRDSRSVMYHGSCVPL